MTYSRKKRFFFCKSLSGSIRILILWQGRDSNPHDPCGSRELKSRVATSYTNLPYLERQMGLEPTALGLGSPRSA